MSNSETKKLSGREPTDLELMTDVCDGDEAAFETLVRRHEDRVFSLAARILGRTDEARDAAQETFIKLWENPQAWKPSALFTTWLYRVTTNHALNRLRSIKLKRLVSLTGWRSDADADVDADLIEDEGVNPPDEILLQAERQAQLERAMAELNPRQRAALHLRYREELSVGEVAAVLGVSVKSAESLIYRGKQRLRKLL